MGACHLLGHVVEGLSQLVHLVALHLRHSDAALKIATGDGVGRPGQRAQRFDHLTRQNERDRHCHGERPEGRQGRTAQQLTLGGDDRRARLGRDDARPRAGQRQRPPRSAVAAHRAHRANLPCVRACDTLH